MLHYNFNAILMIKPFNAQDKSVILFNSQIYRFEYANYYSKVFFLSRVFLYSYLNDSVVVLTEF